MLFGGKKAEESLFDFIFDNINHLVMLSRFVGVYRTAFPLYSETFISGQIHSFSKFSPVVICRDPVGPINNFDVVTLTCRFKFFEKLFFTAFGVSGFFDNENLLKKLNLIHAHFAPDAVLALSLANRLKIPLVATCHGSDVMVSDGYLLMSGLLTNLRYLAMRGKLMRETSLFIAVSKFLRNSMIARGYPEDKVITHYIGVDTTRFMPLATSQRCISGGEYILSVARHTDVKGLDLLFRAFSRVHQLHPNFRLIQIGGGELTQNLTKLVNELGINDCVEFLGPQPPSEVLRYLQSCKALVLSSRQSSSGAEEAFGLVLAEASACGVPCIGTNIGGIPEAVMHGETGLIVEPENAEMLADTICYLLEDNHLAERLGKRGREMIMDCFDLKKQTKKLENIYEGILA